MQIQQDKEKINSTISNSLSNFVPALVTRERFAEMTGLPIGVIVGFCNKGYLPTLAVGKYSLINLELLRKTCLEREFKWL